MAQALKQSEDSAKVNFPKSHSDKPRIALCAYDNPAALSGPSSWFQRMVPELLNRGFDIRPQIFWWTDRENGLLVRFLRQIGLEFDLHQFSTTQSNVKSLLDAAKSYLPHVLVADNVIPALMSVSALRCNGVRTVGILRSDDAFYHGIIDRFSGDRPANRPDVFVCVSEFLKHEVTRRSSGQCPAITIPSGTPVPDRVAEFRGDGSFQVAYVGRLVQEQKRILETAGCLIKLCREIENVSALIIGDGPELHAVEEIVSKAEVPCKLVGRRSPAEVQGLLLDCQALLLLSDYEGTPTAVMEAMACGVVPICLNLRSGIPELVQHEKTGLIVNDRDQSVVLAVQRLKSDERHWRRLSNASRKHAQQRFSSQRSVDLWETLLTSEASQAKPQWVASSKSLNLPATHRGFQHQDVREPSMMASAFGRLRSGYFLIRKWLGKRRRMVFSSCRCY
jgi:colanic acid/amylovoran biosynthesis glycosyltransferase